MAMSWEGIQSTTHAISRAGAKVLVGTLIVFLGDLLAMIVYTIRRGKPDEESGKVVDSNEPLSPMWASGLARVRARSKRKILGNRKDFVTTESLADGTATTAERLMVGGIVLFLFCFWFLWVAIGMWVLPDSPWVILMSIVPGIFVFNIYRAAYQDYVKAKQKLSRQRQE